MSGHSKWATIKRKKAKTDSKRSSIFTKLAKEITVAAKLGGGNLESNARLRLAVQNARKNSVPKDAIERAINKGAGSDSANLTEIVYDGYGPGGIAIVVECTTDNLNRSAANIRSYFNKVGGNFGSSVRFMFSQKGVFIIQDNNFDSESFIFELLDAGAEDAELNDGFYTVICPFEQYGQMIAFFEAHKIEPESTTLEWIPANHTGTDIENATKVMKLIDLLEDDDDVQHVYHNLELTDELLEKIS
ncbi:MAG: YebC/PmpR family DNA-binding transcriptional regulator [Bacteroidia bacterium]|nr:YebC/PmpR family DNA-binding transcriptional regulator [Bacteroidia bacterium]